MRIVLQYWLRLDNKIECDEEFKSIMDEVKDSLSVEMDYSDPGMHEHTAEFFSGIPRLEFCLQAIGFESGLFR